MKQFRESQRLAAWCSFIPLALSLYTGWGVIQQVILGETFGDRPVGDATLISIFLAVTAMTVLFLTARVNTVIDANRIYVSTTFFPSSEEIYWKNVRSAEIIKYSFVGFGIRFTSKYGTVFNAKGSKGLQIETLKGSKFLIGTQRPEELSVFIANHIQLPIAV